MVGFNVIPEKQQLKDFSNLYHEQNFVSKLTCFKGKTKTAIDLFLINKRRPTFCILLLPDYHKVIYNFLKATFTKGKVNSFIADV